VLKCTRLSSPYGTVNVDADAVSPVYAITATGKATKNKTGTLQRSGSPNRADGCFKAAKHPVHNAGDTGKIHTDS
jgi:hypothetical protein